LPNAKLHVDPRFSSAPIRFHADTPHNVLFAIATEGQSREAPSISNSVLPHHIYNQNTTVHSTFYSPSPLPSLSTATTMAARAPQHSATSLARYATARQPDVDLFNGSASRDYCNSFWGLGDSGPNIMFARMRGASKTTDELRNFWNERCVAAWQSIF